MIDLLSDFFLVQWYGIIDDMELHIKPTLISKRELIIIHCDANDQKNNTPQSIAYNFLSLAKSSQERNNIVLVSLIVTRKVHLDKKGKG